MPSKAEIRTLSRAAAEEAYEAALAEISKIVPAPFEVAGTSFAEVTIDGNLLILRNGPNGLFSPKYALALGHWLLDAFGDEKYAAAVAALPALEALDAVV